MYGWPIMWNHVALYQLLHSVFFSQKGNGKQTSVIIKLPVVCYVLGEFRVGISVASFWLV